MLEVGRRNMPSQVMLLQVPRYLSSRATGGWELPSTLSTRNFRQLRQYLYGKKMALLQRLSVPPQLMYTPAAERSWGILTGGVNNQESPRNPIGFRHPTFHRTDGSNESSLLPLNFELSFG